MTSLIQAGVLSCHIQSHTSTGDAPKNQAIANAKSVRTTPKIAHVTMILTASRVPSAITPPDGRGTSACRRSGWRAETKTPSDCGRSISLISIVSSIHGR